MNKDIRTALIIGGIIVAALVVVSIFGGWGGYSGYGGYGGMMGPWAGGTGWGWFMPILMIVFWGLVIWAIVALVRGLSSGGGSRQEESALDVLKKRYARGEISKEEYEAKKKDLL
ncbi:MAG: SHOCT domain-containing protein [Chloroflexota bacterium]